jgi:hypothetical protein
VVEALTCSHTQGLATDQVEAVATGHFHILSDGASNVAVIAFAGTGVFDQKDVGSTDPAHFTDKRGSIFVGVVLDHRDREDEIELAVAKGQAAAIDQHDLDARPGSELHHLRDDVAACEPLRPPRLEAREVAPRAAADFEDRTARDRHPRKEAIQKALPLVAEKRRIVASNDTASSLDLSGDNIPVLPLVVGNIPRLSGIEASASTRPVRTAAVAHRPS